MQPFKFHEEKTDYCNACPLKGQKKNFVPSFFVGDPKKAKFVLIGEAPGKEEDQNTEPFCGESGRLLRKSMTAVGIDNYILTNLVRCNPIGSKGENRPPTDPERECCLDYLTDDLKRIVRNIEDIKIIFVGKVAYSAFKEEETFKPNAEFEIKIKKTLVPATVVYHPSYILRNRGSLEDKYKISLSKATSNVVTSRNTLDFKWHAIETIARLKKLLKYLSKRDRQEPISFDIEADSLEVNKILTIAFGVENKAFVIPLQHKESPWTNNEYKKARKIVRQIFEQEHTWVGHNTKFDLKAILRHYKPNLKAVHSSDWLDTMLIFHNLDLERKDMALAFCFTATCGFNPYAEGEKDIRKDMANVDLKKIYAYNSKDAHVTLRLFRELKKQNDKKWPTVEILHRNLLSKATMMLSRTENAGIMADVGYVHSLMSKGSAIETEYKKLMEEFKNDKTVKKVNKELAATQPKNLFGGAGSDFVFDLRKREHLLKLFIEELDLEPLVEKKTGPSINSAFLEHYQEECPAAKALNNIRGLLKLKDSYIQSLPKFIGHDGRVHADFRLNGTATGRLSVNRPNLQQLPRVVEGGFGAAVKNIFIAKEGCTFLQADYSQAEVRWLGQISKDEKILEAFELMKKDKNLDFHKRTASLMFDTKVEAVTKEERQAAKSITFGLVYGMSSYGLSASLGVSDQEANDLMRKFFSQFGKVKQWFTYIEEFAVNHGFVTTPFGRVRGIPEVSYQEKSMINRGKRKARNTPIQSAASDMTLLQASLLQRHIDEANLGWSIINLIHDAVMVEVPIDEKEDAKELLSRYLTNTKQIETLFPIRFIVPFKVDLTEGPSWGAMK